MEEKVPGTTPSPGINIGRKVLPSDLKQRKLASISFSSSGAMGGGGRLHHSTQIPAQLKLSQILHHEKVN